MAKFGAAVVREEPGGGALSTDSDPNTTAPIDKTTHESQESNVTEELFALPEGGTTISVRPWVREPTSGRWFALSATVACAADEATSLGSIPKGAKVFGQITANTGVTKLTVGVSK